MTNSGEYFRHEHDRPAQAGRDARFTFGCLSSEACENSVPLDSRAQRVSKTLVPILKDAIADEARVMTDEAGQYKKLGAEFAGHGFTRHGQGEYVDLVDRTIHTNTIEGAFSVFKRGMKGVYQHCGKQHLHRYLAEFDFRYNNRVKLGVDDSERAERALRGVVGKRLKYRPANQSAL